MGDPRPVQRALFGLRSRTEHERRHQGWLLPKRPDDVFAQPPADHLDASVEALEAGAAGIDPVAAVRLEEAAEVAS